MLARFIASRTACAACIWRALGLVAAVSVENVVAQQMQTPCSPIRARKPSTAGCDGHPLVAWPQRYTRMRVFGLGSVAHSMALLLKWLCEHSLCGCGTSSEAEMACRRVHSVFRLATRRQRQMYSAHMRSAIMMFVSRPGHCLRAELH